MCDEIRIYVADLAAYNSGKLYGIWIDATLDVEEIEAQVHKMLAGSPESYAEEWAIHDYEGFGGVGISEYQSFETIHEIALFLEEHGKLGAAVLSHWCDDLVEAGKALKENYAGEHGSAADYAQELTQETTVIPENLSFYIDYEAMARDMELSGDIYTIETAFDEVHIFWNHYH